MKKKKKEHINKEEKFWNYLLLRELNTQTCHCLQFSAIYNFIEQSLKTLT